LVLRFRDGVVMFAQAVEVAVVGQDERVSLQLLPHQYVRAFTLDNLYRFF